LPASTLAGAVRVVVVLDTAEELLSELDELARLELTRLELAVLELITLALLKLIAELLVVVTGGLDLVLPLPPPQAVKVKLKLRLKRLAMKTGLINLIIVSGIQAAPLLSCCGQNQ